MTIDDLKVKFNLNNNYCKKIDYYYKELKNSKITPDKLDIIENLYNYINNISSDFYYKEIGKINEQFSGILRMVLLCERLLPQEYIIDTKPKYNYTKKLDKNSNNNIKAILDYIVNQTRNYLYEKNIQWINVNHGFECVDLQCECIGASIFIEQLCSKLSINCRRVLLHPGFTEDPCLCKGVNLHCFNIIRLDGKEYLIDCTYSQFFMLKRCILERIGVMGLSGCQAGIFMTMTEERRKVADKILKEGWIELKNNVLKNYLDGFAISYRNGLYYEQNNDFSYETNYSDNDYWNFLNGQDNQVNHESELVLGYSKRPLLNPNLKFSR